MANFTEQDLKQIELCNTVEEAKAKLIEILTKSSKGNSHAPIQPRKIAYLTHVSMGKAKTVNDIVKIGWNMLLSGENLNVKSRYQQDHKEW